MVATKAKEVELMDWDASLDFDGLENEIVEGVGVPYCQIKSPLNTPGDKGPYGIFVPLDQAELVGFNPDQCWTEVDLTFSEDAEPVKGYLTTNPRMVIIHRSQQEVREYNSKGYKYLDQAYRKGQRTAAALMVDNHKGDNNPYRVVSRYLIAFVDSKGQIIQESPLSLTVRGGFATSLSYELKDFYETTDKSVIQMARASGKEIKGQKLSDRVHAWQVFNCTLGWHRTANDKAPFLCITSRFEATADKAQVGKIRTLNRKAGDSTRKVEVTVKPITSISLPSKDVVNQWFDDYGQFPLPNAGRSDVDADNGGDPHQYLEGTVSDPQYNDDGSLTVTVNTGDEETLVVVRDPVLDAFTSATDRTNQFKMKVLHGVLVHFDAIVPTELNPETDEF